MNEELTNKANEVLLKMLEGLEKAGDFIVEETPEVVQQLLTWHMVESIVGCLFSITIAILFCVAYSKLWKHTGDDDLHYADSIAVRIFSALICGGVCISIVVCNFNLVWLKILVAPKLYLLEYASQLVS